MNATDSKAVAIHGETDVTINGVHWVKCSDAATKRYDILYFTVVGEVWLWVRRNGEGGELYGEVSEIGRPSVTHELVHINDLEPLVERMFVIAGLVA